MLLFFAQQYFPFATSRVGMRLNKIGHPKVRLHIIHKADNQRRVHGKHNSEQQQEKYSIIL